MARALVIAFLLALAVPAAAQAAADGGWRETNTDLAIRPEGTPYEMAIGTGTAVMLVHMPVTKRINRVELGSFRHVCTTSPSVRLRIEYHADGDPWGQTTSYVDSPQGSFLPSTTDVVSWDMPTTTLKKGHAYVFRLLANSGCTGYNWRVTSWPNAKPVYGGTSACAQSAGDISWRRAAHGMGVTPDNGCGAWNFQSSMPPGWLVVKPCNVGTCQEVVTRDAVTTPTTPCVGTTWLNGGKWRYWRPSPVTAGRNDYVCVYDQYADVGADPQPPFSKGWHYGLKWAGSETATGANGQPRDMYLTLKTIDYGALLQKHRPRFLYDGTEEFYADDAREMTDTTYTVLERQFEEDDPQYGDWPGGRRTIADPPSLEGLGVEYPSWFPYTSPDPGRDQLAAHGDEYEARDFFYSQRPQHRDQVYARAIHGADGTLWLQYWAFYYFNSYEAFSVGRHPGDWEMIQVSVNDAGVPQEVTYAQHTYAERCRFDQVRDPTNNDVPMVWVGARSHAAYTLPGWSPIDNGVPDHGDDHFGDGRDTRPDAQVVAGELANFWGWPGRWGQETGLASSPPAPMNQGEKWTNPYAFHAGARACEAPLLPARNGRRTRPAALRRLPVPAIAVGTVGNRARIRYELVRPPRERLDLQVVIRSADRSQPANVQSVRLRRAGTISLRLPPGARPYQVEAHVIDAHGRHGKRARKALP